MRAPPRPNAPTDVPAVPVDGPAERVADLATGGVQMVAGRVSSGIGCALGQRRHNGIDIAAPAGTPIHAPVAGEVIASGPASGFGLWVRVRHDDGTVTPRTGTSTGPWFRWARR